MENKIDVVYTWVDGTDPLHQAKFKKYIDGNASVILSDSISPQRYRNNDELKYSLRSLEKFAPWINKIYIVTSEQTPIWLDTSNNRVSIIPDKILFPNKSDLPTFNSTSIELNLHRIPNLTKKFLYFNDDFFLGNKISISDFITSKGQILYFQQFKLHSDLNEGSAHNRAYAYTQNIIEKYWGKKNQRFFPAHAPRLFDLDILFKLENMMPDEFRKSSSHKYRATDDLVMHVLYSYYLLEHHEQNDLHIAKILNNFSKDYEYVELGVSSFRLKYKFWKIRVKKPKFFCINDTLGSVPLNHINLNYLRRFLMSYFPTPSSFEKH